MNFIRPSAIGALGQVVDLDILVEPMPETKLMDIAKIQLEPGQLLGIPVDVLTPKGLPAKFRDRLNTCQVLQAGSSPKGCRTNASEIKHLGHVTLINEGDIRKAHGMVVASTNTLHQANHVR